MGRQQHPCAWTIGILNTGDQAVDRLRGHAVDWLVHGSERQCLTGCKRHIVVSDDGDVSGYLESGAKHAVKDADRSEIIRREDGGRSRLLRQRFFGSLRASIQRIASLDNLWFKTMGAHGYLKAFAASPGTTFLRATNVLKSKT